MSLNSLKSLISAYHPYDEHEALDQLTILQSLEQYENILSRDNQICHFTASCWITNPDRNKALLLYHNIYHKWMWPGGHADGESDLLAVALREAKEETSLENLKIISPEIFSLEVFAVLAHIRKAKLVPAHLHLNLSFCFEADDTAPFKIKPDENSEIRWMTFSEIKEQITGGIIQDHYAKLIAKTQQLTSK